MIDWTTPFLPFLHDPLKAGYVCKVNSDGDIDWLQDTAITVSGSHESTIQVKSVGGDGQGRATHLRLHGNPSKFLQGHNVFGSNDLLSLISDSARRVCDILGLQPTPQEWQAIDAGEYRITRVDYNQMFELPSRSDVLAWLRAAEYKSKTRHGRPSMKGGTLYWGQHSRRWSIKAYCKAEEINAPKHKLPDRLQLPELLNWVDNKLRVELTLRSKELTELGLSDAKYLAHEIDHLYRDYMRALHMTEQMTLSSEQLHKLPQRLRSTYVLWTSGEDLRSTLPKPTFYRHRKELMAYGIDITIRKDCFDRSNVVPLVRILEAVPAAIPEWAFDLGLVHHSARRVAIF